jgi:hypothetical protein
MPMGMASVTVRSGSSRRIFCSEFGDPAWPDRFPPAMRNYSVCQDRDRTRCYTRYRREHGSTPMTVVRDRGYHERLAARMADRGRSRAWD